MSTRFSVVCECGASAQQAGLERLAQPLCVLDVGLAAGDLFDVPRVDEHQLEVVLEHRPVGGFQ